MNQKIQLPIGNFPAQQSIFNSKARIVSAVKGRRFGFTRGAANNTIGGALSGKYQKGLWVDTVNSNIERYVERYFIPHLKRLPSNLWSWRKQQKILTIRDFYMDFRSVDNPENIEGFGYDYMILNEAGIILKNEYLWQNAIRPMMWDYKCQAFIGGTPKGKNAFYDLAARGHDPDQPQFETFHFTSFDNPYVPQSIIREDILSMPQLVVKQEIYAEFLEDTGVVFRGVKAIAILQPKPPEINHIYIIGCDLAKLTDYTVITVYDRTNNEQVFQMRFNHLEYPFIRSKIAEVSRKYNKALVMLDSTGVGEPTYDDLSRAGVPVEPIHFTNELKKQMIEKLANWIEMRNLKMLQLDETIQELNNFTYDISEKTDRVHYGAPIGFHDDIVISHALACWGMQPVILRVPPKVLPPIQLDVMRKVADIDNHEDGEYGEYEDSPNTYSQHY